MKKMKRVLSGTLAAMMVAASASFISAADVTFTDRFNSDGSLHWAWEKGYIPYLVEKDVLNGYEQDDGTYMFKPEDKVTRAEFIKMLGETFGLTETADISTKYSDVAATDWFYPYFAKAVEQGYILNYGENANPNGELTREEATALLVRYLELSADEKVAENTFTDYDTINPGFQSYVLMAAKAGIINGYSEDDGTYTFRPKNVLTRAEALTVLYRAAGAIFTKDTSSAEAKAYEENAVIKNGGITLSNQDLDGRVIVSEGADNGTVAFYRTKINDTLYIRGGANIIFDSAEVNTVVVDSEDIINITVQAGTTIEHLIVNERTNVTVGTGTTVKKLTVAEDAQFTNVTGSGKVLMAEINGADFTSSILPEAYEIAKGITASFASKSYKGSSVTAQAFTGTPYVSVELNYHFVNMTAVAAGTVRYYFTNTAEAPDADDFELLYKAAKYGNSFDVRVNKAESKTTYSYSQIKDFKYVVLQLTSADGTEYVPVVISNEVAEGTGFTTDPYLKSSTKIEFTTKAAGTVYYMYSTSGSAMSVSSFLAAYDAQSAALKGEVTDRTAQIDINSRYTDVNDYMVFMYKSESGLCYTPVVVAFGDTGYYFEPDFDLDGTTISAVPNVDGILYYYYSETATLPTPDKFNSSWKNAAYRAYAITYASRTVTVPVDDTVPAKYKYIILCIRDDDNNYLAPIALKLEKESGFAVLPEISDTADILFKASESGIVYYYYTNDSTAPNADTFDSEYDAASAGYRGLIAVDTGYKSITFDAKKGAYMVFMLEGSSGTSYHPVVLSLTTAAGTGFSTEPYMINSNTVGFKVKTDCEVWWFYSRVSNTVTADAFWGKWGLAQYGNSISVKAGELITVTVDKDAVEAFPYIVFSTSETFRGEEFTTPVMLRLETTASGTTADDTGFAVTNVTKYELTLTGFIDGTVYYYETNDTTVPTKTGFDSVYLSTESALRGSVSVEEGEKNIEISISGGKKYVVLQMENYDENGRVYYNVVQVNVTSGSSSSGTGSSSGTTVTGKYGFTVSNIDFRNSKLTVKPDYSGKVTVTIGTADKTWTFTGTTYDVVKNQSLVITYPSAITSIGDEPLYIFLQLTDTNGNKYTEYPGLQLISMN